MITIPVLTLLAIFLLYQVRNKFHFGPISFLILTYVLMGMMSLLCELFPILFISSPIRLEPMLFLSACFLVIFSGFWGFNDGRFRSIEIENIILYRWMELVLIIGGFLSILFFLPFAMTAFKGDVGANRNEVYQYGTGLEKYGLFNSVFSLLANLSILAQVCGFLNLIRINDKRRVRRAILLLLSSLSYVVYLLAYVGRDGVIYWTMSFMFCFFLFRGFLSKDDLKKIKQGFAVILIMIFIPFGMITASRFSSSSVGTGLSMISYGGQQIRNFNDHYLLNAPIQHGRLDFPVFVDILESVNLKEKGNLGYDQLSYFFSDYEMPIGVFTTFIGEFMLDFGKAGVLIALAILALSARSATKDLVLTGKIEFSNLLLFVLLYQMVHWGVFYFRQSSTNFYLIGMLLIIIVFKWFGKSPLPWPRLRIVRALM